MFYPKKKSCSVDVLKFWKYNFLLVLLADAVRGWRDSADRESMEGFHIPVRGTQRGEVTRHPQLCEKVIRFDDRWDDIPEENRKSGMYKISLPEMKLPSPRTDPKSSASPGLNRRAHWAVSACQHQSPQHLNHSYSGTIQYPVHEKYYCWLRINIFLLI